MTPSAVPPDRVPMGDLAESKPSFYRRNIQQGMAEKAYERGRISAWSRGLAELLRVARAIVA